MDKRWGGVSRFSVGNFLSHSAKNFRRGESFSVSLISRIEKVWIRRGEYQDFPSKIFSLAVPKNLVGEHFSVSLISGIGKFYASEGYVTFLDFLSKFFCLTVPKKFRGGESFSVSLISGIGNIYASEGYVTIFDFLSKFFCLTVPKNLVGGTPLVFH